MTKRSLTAGVFAGALLVCASAQAADLDYRNGPTDRYSSAYEDPRYRDLYAPEPRGYSYDYRAVPPPPPVPPAYVFRHNEPPYHDHRNGDYRRGDRHGSYCVPREEAKRRLINEGWRDFHDLELRNDVAKIRARRPNGDLYDLKIDRCTGEIVHSHFLQRGGYGPYAHDQGPSRWERTY